MEYMQRPLPLPLYPMPALVVFLELGKRRHAPVHLRGGLQGLRRRLGRGAVQQVDLVRRLEAVLDGPLDQREARRGTVP